MDKNYDDGLVHCHNWACAPETPAQPQGAEIAAPASTSAHPDEGAFDDALVHGPDEARGSSDADGRPGRQRSRRRNQQGILGQPMPGPRLLSGKRWVRKVIPSALVADSHVKLPPLRA